MPSFRAADLARLLSSVDRDTLREAAVISGVEDLFPSPMMEILQPTGDLVAENATRLRFATAYLEWFLTGETLEPDEDLGAEIVGIISGLAAARLAGGPLGVAIGIVVEEVVGRLLEGFSSQQQGLLSENDVRRIYNWAIEIDQVVPTLPLAATPQENVYLNAIVEMSFIARRIRDLCYAALAR